MPIQAIAFDAYGTLFDVYSIAALAERLFPMSGVGMVVSWREKQLEYTHLLTMGNMYKPFWEVTQDALIFCCKKHNIELTPTTQQALMGEYAKLQAFPENLAVLQQLQGRGIKLGILSNGSPQMLDSAVAAASMTSLFDHILSVDTVKKYKTAPEAYQIGPDGFGLPVEEILFVSGNGWDACCATWFGYTTFWVNRADAPLEELGITPHGMGRTLNDVIAFIDNYK
jgi:2-haloacid dehalogenase